MIRVDEKEVYRYLGYRGAVPDTEIREKVSACVERLLAVIEPRSVRKSFPIIRREDGNGGSILQIAGMEISSYALTRNLRGCTEAVLFAATIGLGADRLIRKAMVAGISDAVILQAAAAAAIEEYCDEMNGEIVRDAAERELFVRPRFSPGYGDFPLAHQGGFLQVLDAQKRAGIHLTDGDLMVPSKSVTALTGLSAENAGCVLQGCEACGKKECAFRR